MNRRELLARLLSQAAGSGGDMVTLRAIVEEASEIGAERALQRLGLADPGAESDMAELRQLLGAWRSAKTSAWKAALNWVTHMLMAMLLAGMAWRLGLGELIK